MQISQEKSFNEQKNGIITSFTDQYQDQKQYLSSFQTKNNLNKIYRKINKQKLKNSSTKKYICQYVQNKEILNDKQLLKQNFLNKIKNYSRILYDSSKLSKIIETERDQKLNNSKQKNESALDSLQLMDEPQIQREMDQVQNIYKKCLLKNQRKHKILSRAKLLGKNNFYRFLKGTSIVQTNKHLHRFHQQIDDSDCVKNIFYKENNPEPLIKSLQQNKSQIQAKNIPLPLIVSKKYFSNKKQNKRNKSQQPIQKKNNQYFQNPQQGKINKQLGSLRIINQTQIRRQKKPMKRITRSLTQINQKIKKDRNQKHIKSKKLLFFSQNQSNNQIQQLFVQKWKYKSIFQTLNKQYQVQSNFRQEIMNHPLNLSMQKYSSSLKSDSKLSNTKNKNRLKQKLTELNKSNFNKQRLEMQIREQQTKQIQKLKYLKKQRKVKLRSLLSLKAQNQMQNCHL